MKTTNFSKIFLFFTIISFSWNFNAQNSKTPKQIQVNGETYFVYPYGQKIKAHYTFNRLINYLDKDELRKYYIYDSPKATEEEIGYFLKGVEEYLQKIRVNNPTQHKSNQEMLKVCLQNTDKFMQPQIYLDVDIIPSLDALPDGKYIQYYEDYYRITKQGQFEFKKDVIAGVFSLKKNTLHGKATWFNSLGDTIKTGEFNNGLKTGEWIYQTADISFYTARTAQEIVSNPLKFTKKKYTFSNGTMNGPYSMFEGGFLVEKGAFKEGVESGEWFEYKTKKVYDIDKLKDTIILKKHYTYASDKKLSHTYFVRSSVFESELPEEKFELPSYKLPEFDFFTLIEWNREEEEDLELPEEKMTYYDGYQGEGDYGYERDFAYDGEYSAFEFWNNVFYIYGKEVNKSKIIDSIGYFNLYEDVYEEFYDNGKIKVRYTYKNGNIEEEGNVYWDNGTIANSITWNNDLSVYEEKFFDYNGTLFTLNHYKKNGDFIKQIIDPLYDEKHTKIDSMLVFIDKRIHMLPSYEYNKLDTLKYVLTEPLILKKIWYSNFGVQEQVTYNPKTRILESELNSFNGTNIEKQKYEYAADFSNYRAQIQRNFRNLSCEIIENGSYSVNRFGYGFGSEYEYDEDTILQKRVINPFAYETSSDLTLKVNKKPFSGSFEYNLGSKKNTFSIKNSSIQIALNMNPKFQKQVLDDMKENKGSKDSKFKKIYDILETNGRLDEQMKLFFPEVANLLRNNNYIYDNLPYYKGVKIIGNYLDGKASGVWKVLNEKDQVIIQCSFSKGEMDGVTNYYSYAFPENLNEFDYYYDPLLKFQEYPKKVTYYLSDIETYKSGILQGVSERYDWTGKVISRVEYDKGMENGKAFERNPLVYTESYYDHGMLDGITSTYLTLPGKDSILLFNLNFQDGLLQGESKSYHTNGKLSKRGFFLDGRAIDDYEGYDSLGFKYHYIKFLYSFPVEEKIYEFNQLSVKYQFDWKDSIMFVPDDITNANSVEAVLYQMNLMGEEGDMPYMGRPSLIYKGNITYHMTKYYPNDTIARDGKLKDNRKIGPWYFNAFDGTRLYNVNYFDTILVINDSIKFKAKGILTDVDANGKELSKSYIIERIEKYDCSHTDHYEQRQFYTIWQAHDSVGRMNGYVKNYYDNGTLQSEGNMKNGLPTGIWKLYDPYGQLNQVGEYVMGKRNGRWLSGDLSKSKYLGDICMNPNLPDLEERMEYQEKLLDIYIRYFKLGKILNSEYYDLNLNEYEKEGEEEEK